MCFIYKDPTLKVFSTLPKYDRKIFLSDFVNEPHKVGIHKTSYYHLKMTITTGMLGSVFTTLHFLRNYVNITPKL